MQPSSGGQKPLFGVTWPLNGLNFACPSAYSTFRPFACAGRTSNSVHGALTGMLKGVSTRTEASAGLGMAAIPRPLIIIVPLSPAHRGHPVYQCHQYVVPL